MDYYSVAFSPDANYVYVVKAADNTSVAFNLLRAPLFGGVPQVIVRNIDSNPSFSPDGSRIVFLRHNVPEIGKIQILTVRSDGTEEKVIRTSDQRDGFDQLVAGRRALRGIGRYTRQTRSARSSSIR